MDTFTLKIHVTGLGLFAPHPSSKDNSDPAMHLLLPRVLGHQGRGERGHSQHGARGGEAHQHPDHVARLYFDPKDAPDHAGPPWVPVDGFRWIAPSRGTPVLNTTLPDEIINITKNASNCAKLPLAQLAHGTQFNVSFHLMLRDGATAECLVPRARFTVDGAEPTWSTNHVIWEIPGLPRSAFDIDLTPLKDQHQLSPETVTIVPQGPEVVLHLLNVPESEHAPTLSGEDMEPQCDEATHNHFSAYERLFRNGATKRIRCVKNSFERRSCPPPPVGRARAKVIYTCMLATAELAPKP